MMRDAAIVGAGLSGLVAGIALQRAGVETVIVERSARAGGLSGTFEHDGFEFVIGCNDFGVGFEKQLGELGVDIHFHHPRARFHFGHRRIQLPPDVRTLARLVPSLPALVSALRGTRCATTLGELVDHHIRDPLLADLACLPAFAMMRSPDDVTLSALKADFSRELGYGYDKSCTPVGGPQALVDRMVRRFEELGGRLLLRHECLEIGRGAAGHLLRTPEREIRARHVLSTQGRWSEYPRAAKAGLEVGLVLLVVRQACPFPRHLHTLDWFGPGVARMLRRLDAGNAVETPAFHGFRSDLAPRDGCYTLNVFLPLPRGQGDLAPPQRRRFLQHVEQTLARLLPGFREALVRSHFLSPDEYAERFGFRPQPSRRILPPGVDKPPSFDDIRRVHFLGTSVDPPGEHAGAAALSGWRAARRIIADRVTELRQPHP